MTILISRPVLVEVGRFLNIKNLIGFGRIRIHKNRNKQQIISDLKRFFSIISFESSFRLVPKAHFLPLLPEVCYHDSRFYLNGRFYQSLFDYCPYRVS